jgi:hypothetical protein
LANVTGLSKKFCRPAPVGARVPDICPMTVDGRKTGENLRRKTGENLADFRRKVYHEFQHEV